MKQTNRFGVRRNGQTAGGLLRMRDYKQMKEIQELRKRQEEEERLADPAAEAEADEAENDRYAHRGPGFRGWIAHVWEYYKWPILIIGIIAVGVIIGIRQAAASSNPDLAVTYVGPFYLSADNQKELEADFSDLSGSVQGDYNGDGEYRLSFLDITITYVRDADSKVYTYDEQNSAYTRFQTELRAGDTMLYFLDKRYYLEAKDEGVLQPVKDVLNEEEAKLSFDGFGIYLGDLNAYARPGLSRMPAGTVVCLRRSPDRDVLQYGRTAESWESHADLFRALVKGTRPEENGTSSGAVTLFYASQEPCYRSVREDLRTSIKDLLADAGADLGKPVDVRAVDKNGSEARIAVQSKAVRTELVTGNSFLWLLDEESFVYAKERGLLEPLPANLASDKASRDGYGLLLSELPLYEWNGFRDLRADSILCLRRAPQGETESYGRTAEEFRIAQTAFSVLGSAKSPVPEA